MNIKGRQTLRRNQLYFDFPPLTIPSWISWTVSEHILVAQLDPNLCSHVRKLIRIVNAKEAATGNLAYLVQKIGAIALFLGCRTIVKDADRINLDIGLLHHRANFAVSITAAIVTTIRDHQKGLLAMRGLLHLIHTHIDGIEQRRAAFGHGVNQFALNVFNRISEVRNDFWLVIEGHQEEFVLRVSRLEELDHCFLGLIDLIAHAAAHIEDYA